MNKFYLNLFFVFLKYIRIKEGDYFLKTISQNRAPVISSARNVPTVLCYYSDSCFGGEEHGMRFGTGIQSLNQVQVQWKTCYR
jgi:hypothetical protein